MKLSRFFTEWNGSFKSIKVLKWNKKPKSIFNHYFSILKCKLITLNLIIILTFLWHIYSNFFFFNSVRIRVRFEIRQKKFDSKFGFLKNGNSDSIRYLVFTKNAYTNSIRIRVKIIRFDKFDIPCPPPPIKKKKKENFT